MATTAREQGTAELSGHQGYSIISNERLRQLYLSMVKCRLVEESLRARNHEGEIDSAVGSEAAAAGVIAGLLPDDAVSAAPGNLMVQFLQNEIRGGPLKELLTHDDEPDFATRLMLTLQAAQTSKTAGKSQIIAVFSEADSGFPGKMLERASAKRLPILFVRHSTDLSEADGAREFGVPVIPVDGADVVAVYRVATESITHARKGNGPTLIDCIFDPAQAHDPIPKMEAYLSRKGLFREEWKLAEVADFSRKLDAVVAASIRS